MVMPAVLVLDDDDPLLAGYGECERPSSWRTLIGARRRLGELYNLVFDLIPDAPCYGFLCDDAVPLTPGWDIALAAIAGTDGLAAPAGGHHPTIAPHFCLGGDLVRDTGWLALPGLDRLYIDRVWHDIARATGVYRAAPEVVIEHRHFSTGQALYDSTYRKDHKDDDRAAYRAWRHTFETEGTHR